MKITLLGTGSSTGTPQLLCNCHVCSGDDPHNWRSRFAILVETDQRTILVDAPPELRIQLLKANVTKIDALWLTHHHTDHIAGIDDLRIPAFRQGGTIPALMSKSCFDVITPRYPYLFGTNIYRTEKFLEPHLVSNKPQPLFGMRLTPVFHQHGDIEVMSFRLGNFAFLADISSIDDKELEKLEGVSLLVVSSTVLNMHNQNKHMMLDQVIELCSKVGAAQSVLTHMNHHYDYESVKQKLPEGIEPGYDGMVLETE